MSQSKITATTVTKYIEYLKDAFMIEEANRYDIKGKSYIGTPQKYYFMDMGLRNARINYRQQEVTHSMENVIYNELRMRGYKVDVGNLQITESGKNGPDTVRAGLIDMPENSCIMQKWADTEKSALPICNYSHILY